MLFPLAVAYVQELNLEGGNLGAFYHGKCDSRWITLSGFLSAQVITGQFVLHHFPKCEPRVLKVVVGGSYLLEVVVTMETGMQRLAVIAIAELRRGSLYYADMHAAYWSSHTPLTLSCQ